MNQVSKTVLGIACVILSVACAVNAAVAEEPTKSILAVAVSSVELRGQFVMTQGYDLGLSLTLDENRGTLNIAQSDGSREIAFEFIIKDEVVHLKFDQTGVRPPLADLVIAKVDGELILIPQPIVHAFCVEFKKDPAYTVYRNSFRLDSFKLQLNGKSQLVLPAEYEDCKMAKEVSAHVIEVTDARKDASAASNPVAHRLKLDQGEKQHVFKGMLLQLDDNSVASVEEVYDSEAIAIYTAANSNGESLMGKVFSTSKNPMIALYGLLPAIGK